MTDDNNDAGADATQWAFIFNTLGKDRLRKMLFEIAMTLEQDEEDDRRVIEVRTDDGEIRALDITDHVEVLEDEYQQEYGRPAAGKMREQNTTEL